MNDIATQFVTCGHVMLPDSAAPCLTFRDAFRPLPIWEVYAFPSYWSSADRERLAPYLMIGFDGAGNPICVEQDVGTVVMLDHEDLFRSLKFVNSSVCQLAECLLAYMGEQKPERFRSTVQILDPAALDDGSFWWYEVAALDADVKPLAGSTNSSDNRDSPP